MGAQRYYSDGYGSVIPSDDGDYVKFDDYEKLAKSIQNYFTVYKNEGKINGWCKRVDTAKQEIFDLLK